MARRRINGSEGTLAVRAWQQDEATTAQVRIAVRYALQTLADVAPGTSVEVRVPPAGVVQVIEGPRHTRGTPPNVVETNPDTFLAIVTGRLTWADAVRGGAVSASGSRANLADWMPLLPAHGQLRPAEQV